MDKLKNDALVGNTSTFVNETDLPGSEGLESMKVDSVKPEFLPHTLAIAAVHCEVEALVVLGCVFVPPFPFGFSSIAKRKSWDRWCVRRSPSFN